MNQSIKLIVSVILGFFAGVTLHAQVTTSAISGKLNDNEGPVQGAVIIAVHTPSGSQYTAVSDKNGSYRINGVIPGGPYTVKVECLGYRPIENTGVEAPLGEAVAINNTLEVEAIGLEAAVLVADGSESGMNIDRSGASTSINQRRMSSIPTVDRSMNDIMRLTPQAATTSNGFAVGGGSYRSSYVTVDGAAFNNAFGIGSNLPAGGTPISLDALELMSVNITPYDVRQSGFTGAAINAVTKRGTNDWHASAYNYFNSDQLKGNRVGEDEVAISKSLNNTTGVTVGGPIIKDKLFFFVNFEYTRDVVPGSSRRVRESESDAWGGSTSFVRPTREFMEEVKSVLMERYGYNPGRYEDYSLSTPDWKVMARVDWNIHRNHKLNVRYSQTMNKYSSSPSSSVNPLNPNPYNRNTYGRSSEYAQFFESSRYYQEQNFMSLAAELNSSFLDGALNNVFRVTWSHQNEPRSFVGDNFPTVDILDNIDADGDGVDDTRAVITSFGPDPFTYGNLRDVQTVVVTDEVSYTLGINNIVAGVQYEYDNTKNGFMQGGLGYYVYDSWNDFLNDATPAAFAITHSNRDDLKQVYPAFDYHQFSLYAQDELNISDYFKLTAGIRFELPYFPTIEGNTNKEFLELAAANPESSIAGRSTGDMPGVRVNISPRVGFNWDILKNRNLILRGGTGLYTGRIPFVWIVSAVGNSNCMQAQYIATSTGVGNTPDIKTPSFHQNLSDILTDLYGGTFKAQDLPAPTSTTLLDKKLKMPTTWKSSLALDARLPGGIKGTIEGIFNYDLNSVVASYLGIEQIGEVTYQGEPEARPIWRSEGLRNSQGSRVNPYLIRNENSLHGYYYSVTAQLQKDFNFGLSLMAAYTRSGSMNVTDAIGDQISSAYNTNTYNVKGSNTPELGYSSYVTPNRFIASVSYRHEEGRKGATTIGLFYEGYNHAYVGSNSYTRYSYVMNNVTGDNGAQNLIYIPTESDLASMTFSSDENRDAYNAFIKSDKYLSKHRGEYSTRGGAVAPWQSRFNLKVAQDINFNTNNKRTHTIQIGLDINNVANLLNSEWGTTDRLNTNQVLNFDDDNNTYTFTAPEWTKYNSTFSTWEMLLSLKYIF